MKYRILCTVAGMVLLLSACRTGIFSETYLGNNISEPVSIYQLQKSILATFYRYNWLVVTKEDNRIIARKGTENHDVMLLVEVVYDKKGYQINYLDDNGYNIKTEEKTAHVNYSVWMARLRDSISNGYYLYDTESAAVLDSGSAPVEE